MTNKNRWILIGVAAAFVAIVVSMVVFLWPEPLFEYKNVTQMELRNHYCDNPYGVKKSSPIPKNSRPFSDSWSVFIDSAFIGSYPRMTVRGMLIP